jgi:hypothetical protein
MQGAQCKINKARLLIEACNLIDQMKIAEQNQDVQGDPSTWLSASLYEYMLGHMQFAPCASLRGSSTRRGGQFRTPRQREEFAFVVARVESLRGRMGESTRQVDGLFECLLDISFKGN